MYTIIRLQETLRRHCAHPKANLVALVDMSPAWGIYLKQARKKAPRPRILDIVF
jgi:hypothetical protein